MPGIMQNLLLQGVVPVTMLVSIIALRNRGCKQCKEVRVKLKSLHMVFREQSSDPDACTEQHCVCTVTVGDRTYPVCWTNDGWGYNGMI